MNRFTVRRAFSVPLSPLARDVDASHSRRQRDLARGNGVGRLQQRSPWPPARFLLPPAGRPTASSATHPRHGALAALAAHTHPAGMFVVTEAEAAAIRAVYEQSGEFSKPRCFATRPSSAGVFTPGFWPINGPRQKSGATCLTG